MLINYEEITQQDKSAYKNATFLQLYEFYTSNKKIQPIPG